MKDENENKNPNMQHFIIDEKPAVKYIFEFRMRDMLSVYSTEWYAGSEVILSSKYIDINMHIIFFS